METMNWHRGGSTRYSYTPVCGNTSQRSVNTCVSVMNMRTASSRLFCNCAGPAIGTISCSSAARSAIFATLSSQQCHRITPVEFRPGLRTNRLLIVGVGIVEHQLLQHAYPVIWQRDFLTIIGK